MSNEEATAYQKFINFAKQLGTSETGDESFTFDFQGLIRMVDVAFIEGRLVELENFEENLDDDYREEHVEELRSKLGEALAFSGSVPYEVAETE